MKIKKLSATFGNLKNDRLTLEPGLNIIRAPNESGKSTWCAFIRTMLYGISTSSRDKAGFLSDKNRYRPWSGEPMGGSMEIELDGKSVTISRSALGVAPMKKFRAVYTGTGEEVPGLTGENAGERITGVTESVFERTAFIKQAGVRVDQTNELEKRISAIVSSGDEQQSYTETDAALRAWLRKFRYNRSGSLPELEAELAETQERYSKIQAGAEALAGVRQELERLEAQEKQLGEDLKTLELLDVRADAKSVWDLKRRSELAAADLQTLRDQLTVNGRLLTREDVSALREACASAAPLEDVRLRAETALKDAEAQVEQANEKKEVSRFAPGEPAAAFEKVARAFELAKKSDEHAKKSIGKSTRTKTLAAMIAAAVIGVLSVTVYNTLPVLFGAIAVVLAGAVYLLIKRDRPDDSLEKLKTLLRESGFETVSEMKEKADEYAELCRQAGEAEVNLLAARQSLQGAAEACENAKAVAIESVQRIMPETARLSELPERVAAAEKLLDRYARQEFETAAAQKAYAEALEAHGGMLPELDETYISIPLRDRNDTKDAIARTRARHAQVSQQYNLALGQLHAMGDPVVISGRIKEIKERIAADTAKYEALTAAISALAEANTEIRTRFSPLISKAAGDIMRTLTGGRYESLVFDRSFDAETRPAGEPVSRSALALSAGTTDQLYLALRLAMCGIVLPKDDPCPIILDDALVNLDDRRTGLALDLLLKLSGARQILLFTCHSREAEYVTGRDGVNVVSMEK